MMRQADTTKLILPYAGRDADASFQLSDGLIYIHNFYGRLHAYVGWTMATFLTVLPLVRTFVSGTTWFAFDELGAAGWFGAAMYVLTIFACISAGFSWSTVWVNLETGQVERTRRFGLFRKHTVAPLTAFKEINLDRDAEGNTTVELLGSQRMRIVWGRNRKESVRIAREIAAHISLPVAGEYDYDSESEAG